MLPGDGPVFISPSRPNGQVPILGELVNAPEILADEVVARDRSLHVMGHRHLQVTAVIESLPLRHTV